MRAQRPFNRAMLVFAAWIMPSVVVYDVVFTYHNRSFGAIQAQSSINNGHPTLIDPDIFDISVAAAARHLTGARRFFVVVDYKDEIVIPLPPNFKVILSSTLYPASAASGWPYFSSSAKEAYMHKIAGLNSSFLYINDDMIVTNPINPHYFFRSSGSIYTLVGPESKVTPWWSAVFDTARIGSRPSTKYTAEHLFGAGTAHARSLMSMWRYPSHAPRPYYIPYVEHINRTYPTLFSTVFQSKYRCSNCLNANSMMVAGAIVWPRTFKTVPATHYAAQAKFVKCSELIALLKQYSFVTLQGGTKRMAECLRAWWRKFFKHPFAKT